MPKLVALLLLARSAAGTFSYDNTHGGDLLVECDSGYGMNHVKSSFFDSSGGDRLWEWDCEEVYTCIAYFG